MMRGSRKVALAALVAMAMCTTLGSACAADPIWETEVQYFLHDPAPRACAYSAGIGDFDLTSQDWPVVVLRDEPAYFMWVYYDPEIPLGDLYQQWVTDLDSYSDPVDYDDILESWWDWDGNAEVDGGELVTDCWTLSVYTFDATGDYEVQCKIRDMGRGDGEQPTVYHADANDGPNTNDPRNNYTQWDGEDTIYVKVISGDSTDPPTPGVEAQPWMSMQITFVWESDDDPESGTVRYKTWLENETTSQIVKHGPAGRWRDHDPEDEITLDLSGFYLNTADTYRVHVQVWNGLGLTSEGVSDAMRYPWLVDYDELHQKVTFTNDLGVFTLDLSSGVSYSLAVGENPSLTSAGELWSLEYPNMRYSTDATVLDVDDSSQTRIIVIWDYSAYPTDPVSGTLEIDASQAGYLLMRLHAEDFPDEEKVTAVFPQLASVKLTDNGPTGYLIPATATILSEPATSGNVRESKRFPYGGGGGTPPGTPLQFVDIWGEPGGVYLHVRDEELTPKGFRFAKVHDEPTGEHRCNTWASYVTYSDAEGNGCAWTSPWTAIGLHSGDWHAAFDAYREWLKTWWTQDQTPPQWWREMVTMRQDSLWDKALAGQLATELYYEGLGDPPRPPWERDYTFAEGLDAEQGPNGFGCGIDCLHLYGWMTALSNYVNLPEDYWMARAGNYDPWDLPETYYHLPGPTTFAQAIQAAHDEGVPVSLYFEGYLLGEHAPHYSEIDCDPDKWTIYEIVNDDETYHGYKADGTPNYNENPYLDPIYHAFEHYQCPASEWGDWLIGQYSAVKAITNADVYYVDQFGMAKEAFNCYATDTFPAGNDHAHDGVSTALRAENDFLVALRDALDHSVIFTEQTPCDVTAQHVDGSFTVSGFVSDRDNASASGINLCRFALPTVKQIELVNPLNARPDTLGASYVRELRRAFFNGQGIRLLWPASAFTSAQKAFIQMMHRVIHEYADCFFSTDVAPLVDAVTDRTSYPQLHVNRFAGGDSTVWTIFNSSGETAASGECIHVPHTKAASTAIQSARPAWTRM